MCGLALGLALGIAAGSGAGLLLAMAGALVTALVPLLLFKMNAMGGGDVKLLAALGAVVGAEAGLEIEMLAFGIGAVWGLWIWLRKGLLKDGIRSLAGLALGPLGKGLRSSEGAVAARAVSMRFGPAIVLATLAVVMNSIPWR
jgi:prepilin peptidase CpaA